MIHLEHVYKSFGKQEVLHDICLDIADGEVVGLLGPNGVGKSTLMKILLGLWKPDSGIVQVPATHGYLPELNPLYDSMYVREYLSFMFRVESLKCKEDSKKCPSGYSLKSIVESMIEKVGLTPMANKRIGELSKGFRQRVGLAQAMMGNPELLILDEPTTGLDPNQLLEIRGVIGSRGVEGRGVGTTILSTHILQEVEQVCSRVIILDRGVVKYDSAERPSYGLKDRFAEGELEEIFRQVTNYGK